MNRIAVPLLAVFASCTCVDGGVQDTSARVDIGGSVSFGRVYLGETGTRALLVRSIGSAPFSVVSVTPDDFLSGSGLPARVAPGATLELALRWTPVTVTTLATSITVTTDIEGDAPHVVVVTGEALAIPPCDDGNQCTLDSFDRFTESCRHADHTGACDDGSACTQDDRCSDGVCRGAPRSCDDRDVCTLDYCDPATGCVHPPDNRRCDDADPCTTDTCDPAAGCTHPDAPDGTACGALSCAEVHACVFGTCRTLDVTGSSDGFPCSDGDACTDPDTCLAGACVAGPAVHAEPRVVASLPTYGGAKSAVVSDGYRALYLEGTRAAIATLGANEATLVANGIPIADGSIGAVFEPGKFLVADPAGLSLLDATAPASTAALWHHSWETLGFGVGPWVPFRLVRIPLGVFVALRNAATPIVPGGTVGVLPLEAGTGRPGVAFVDFPLAPLVDADADGRLLGVALRPGVTFRLLDAPNGTEVVSQAVPEPPEKISVSGMRAAILHGTTVDVVEISRPPSTPLPCAAGPCATITMFCATSGLAPGTYAACDNTNAACPDPSAECVLTPLDGCGNPRMAPLCMRRPPLSLRRLALLPVKGASDIVLDGAVLAWTGPLGTFEVLLPDEDQPGLISDLPVRTLDLMPHASIDRAPSKLLLAGTAAYALARQQGGYLRLIGPGLGDVTTVTDSVAPRALVGGPVAVGEVDLSTLTFASWRLDDVGSDSAHPKVLRGATRLVPIPGPRVADVAPQSGETTCAGLSVTVAGAATTGDPSKFCGLHFGQQAITRNRFWNVGDEDGVIRDALTAQVLRSWKVPHDVVDAPTTLSFGRGTGPFSIRAPDDGTDVVAVLDRPRAHALRWRFATPLLSGLQFGEDFIEDDPWDGAELPPDAIALDAVSYLVGRGGGGWFGTATNGFSARFFLPGAAETEAVRIPWMAGGRAWLTHRSTTPEVPVERLTEASYDGATRGLTFSGSVATSGPVRAVYDAGRLVVVATDRSVDVVAPACR